MRQVTHASHTPPHALILQGLLQRSPQLRVAVLSGGRQGAAPAGLRRAALPTARGVLLHHGALQRLPQPLLLRQVKLLGRPLHPDHYCMLKSMSPLGQPSKRYPPGSFCVAPAWPAKDQQRVATRPHSWRLACYFGCSASHEILVGYQGLLEIMAGAQTSKDAARAARSCSSASRLPLADSARDRRNATCRAWSSRAVPCL